LATLVQAGLPLLRGLRVLQKQERNANLKGILGELAVSIEGGSTFSEALAQHPKVFNRLFVNMVKAGEIGGVLEVVLKRLSEFMEKAQKIKGKVIAAMFYPCAVLVVATAIMGVLMVWSFPSSRRFLPARWRRQSRCPASPFRPGHQRGHQRPFWRTCWNLSVVIILNFHPHQIWTQALG
jgi:type II secretory pathway component PulF